jgi:hypothetical protein
MGARGGRITNNGAQLCEIAIDITTGTNLNEG